MKVTKIEEMNHQLKNLLIFKQILLVNTLRNVWWIVGRICIMMLECKGLNKNQDYFRPVSSNHVGYFFFLWTEMILTNTTLEFHYQQRF